MLELHRNVNYKKANFKCNPNTLTEIKAEQHVTPSNCVSETKAELDFGISHICGDREWLSV